jgi:hypothetical protein
LRRSCSTTRLAVDRHSPFPRLRRSTRRLAGSTKAGQEACRLPSWAGLLPRAPLPTWTDACSAAVATSKITTIAAKMVRGQLQRATEACAMPRLAIRLFLSVRSNLHAGGRNGAAMSAGQTKLQQCSCRFATGAGVSATQLNAGCLGQLAWMQRLHAAACSMPSCAMIAARPAYAAPTQSCGFTRQIRATHSCSRPFRRLLAAPINSRAPLETGR